MYHNKVILNYLLINDWMLSYILHFLTTPFRAFVVNVFNGSKHVFSPFSKSMVAIVELQQPFTFLYILGETSS